MELHFIGHQSWMASDGKTNILIDPILSDTFGTQDGIEIFPPRTVHIDRMPHLSAILLSHEHSDHFHLPSLHALPRSVEVIIGINMVQPVENALRSLGFRVRRQAPGQPFEIGSLTITLYAASDDTVFWESRVNQFLIFPTDKPIESVFIAVDALIADAFTDDIAQNTIGPPSTIAVSNNAQITPAGVFGSLDNLNDPKGKNAKKGLHGLKIIHSLTSDYLARMPATPNILICGGGFLKGYGELGPFPFSDQKSLADAATGLSRNINIYGPYPGERYTLKDRSLSCDTVEYISLNQDRFTELLSQSQDFIRQNKKLVMRSVTTAPGQTSHSSAAARTTIEKELNRMALSLMLSPLGRSAVELKKHNSVYLGPNRLLVRCLDSKGDIEYQWVLNVVEAAFMAIQSDESPLANYPFGVIVHTQDLLAVITGKLQIWDIAGIALQSWFIGTAETSPVAFLYAWFGEQISSDLATKQYKKEVEALGHSWKFNVADETAKRMVAA